jgi:hypothetical protein
MLKKCIFFCLGCTIVSTICLVMEVYTLLALQFCDGEDLMALYWSTWTMIQVGSLIAVVGIILALCHTIKDRKHPYVPYPSRISHTVVSVLVEDTDLGVIGL